MDTTFIPLNRPSIVGRELEYIDQVMRGGERHGGGAFTRRCQAWLEQRLGGGRAFLSQSCTAALEMAALLAGLEAGDEVIMPSYTFVSTANAFVLRGAVPVFVDIDPATKTICPTAVERAVTSRTRAIVAVHYAGFGCDMEALCAIAVRHRLIVIEDAAQALMAKKVGRPLGSFGELATFSFHDSKNISSGEGGALIVNDPALAERAEILWEKGTNRSRFLRGSADKYTWMDVGSSFLPSEITAAFLLAQLEKADEITAARRDIWAHYHREFAPFDALAEIPAPPSDCYLNGHIFYLVLPDINRRDAFIAGMKEAGISTPFHYVPLHSSPAGQRFGRSVGDLSHTDFAGRGLVRLPLFPALSKDDVTIIARSAIRILESL